MAEWKDVLFYPPAPGAQVLLYVRDEKIPAGGIVVARRIASARPNIPSTWLYDRNVYRLDKDVVVEYRALCWLDVPAIPHEFLTPQ